MLAHIAGIPVEETALNFIPIAAAIGGISGLRLRERLRRSRRRPLPSGPVSGRAR